MKKTLTTAIVIASLTLPLNAIEVYNKDDAKVDVYGSVRGLVGYGSYRQFSENFDNKTFDVGNTIFALQGNSRIGVSANVGKVFGNVELGVKDTAISNTIASGFRHLYAGYNFGEPYGTILIGKTTSIAGTDFSSDIFFTDGGLVGFGNGSQGERRFQVQYKSNYGVSFAIMESSVTNNSITNADETHNNVRLPVFALSYDFIGLDDNLIAKIGASYTQVNVRAKLGNNRTDSNTDNYPVTVNAYAINAAATYKLLDKKLYLTAIASYSLDAHLYSDTMTPKFNAIHSVDDEYKRESEIRQNKQNGIKLYSAALEAGYNILDNLKAVVGGGYQYSIKESLIQDVDFSFIRNNIFQSYGIFSQVSYQINKLLILTPSVGYYGILKAAQNNGPAQIVAENREKYNAQLLAGVQTRLNF